MKRKTLDKNGQQQYLNDAESNEFLSATSRAMAYHRTLALLLFYAGCDITEAIGITPDDVDLQADFVILGKEASRRSIPLPHEVITTIEVIHAIRHLQAHRELKSSVRLWPVDRSTGLRWIQAILRDAGIPKSRANTRLLRHTCALRWVQQGIQLPVFQLWLGNTNLAHTERYYSELVTHLEAFPGNVFKTKA